MEMEAPMRAPWATKAPAASGAPHGGVCMHPALKNVNAPGAAASAGAAHTFQWRGWSFNAPKGPILSTHDAEK